MFKDFWFINYCEKDLPCTLPKLVTKNHSVTRQWFSVDFHIPVPLPVGILSAWRATTHFCHLSPQLVIVYLI